MTRQTDRLTCPRCGAPLATYVGLGQPDAQLLQQWRAAKAEHRPSCLASDSAAVAALLAQEAQESATPPVRPRVGHTPWRWLRRRKPPT